MAYLLNLGYYVVSVSWFRKTCRHFLKMCLPSNNQLASMIKLNAGSRAVQNEHHDKLFHKLLKVLWLRCLFCNQAWPVPFLNSPGAPQTTCMLSLLTAGVSVSLLTGKFCSISQYPISRIFQVTTITPSLTSHLSVIVISVVLWQCKLFSFLVFISFYRHTALYTRDLCVQMHSCHSKRLVSVLQVGTCTK